MTKINWIKNDHSGRFVNRSLKRLENDYDKAPDAEKRMAILNRYVYIWNIKAQIAKSEREFEMEKRIAELEKIAGIAQKAAPVSK